MDPERLVDVHWDIREKRDYPVQMRVICNDKKGILADISAAIALMDVNITHAETNTGDGKATCDFTVNVNDLDQFNRIVAAVKEGARGRIRPETLADESDAESLRDNLRLTPGRCLLYEAQASAKS